MKRILNIVLILCSFGNLIIGAIETDDLTSACENIGRKDLGPSFSEQFEIDLIHEVIDEYNKLAQEPKLLLVPSPNNKFWAFADSLAEKFTISDFNKLTKTIDVDFAITNIKWIPDLLEVSGIDTKEIKFKFARYNNKDLTKLGINIAD